MQIVVSHKVYSMFKNIRLIVKGVHIDIDLNNTFSCLDAQCTEYAVNIDINTQFNYFCVNKQNNITYWDTKKGEQPINDQGKWVREGRSSMKAGKFIMLIQELFCSSDAHWHDIEREVWINALIEHFNYTIQALNTELEYQISTSPSKIYALPTSDKAGEYLKNSCMRKESSYGCRNYSALYDFLCKIVYGVDENGHLLFRALLWEDVTKTYDDGDESLERFTFLDRIYGTETVNLQLQEVAKSKGWLHRNFSSDSVLSPTGEKIGEDIYKNLSKEAAEFITNTGVPYADTLYYFNDDDTLTTDDSYDSYILHECCGNIHGEDEEDNRMCCDDCGDYYDEDDGCWVNDAWYCIECRDERFNTCDRCDEWHDKKDSIYIDNNVYCSSGCAERAGYYECVDCGTWSKSSNEVASGDYVCNKCLEEDYFYCDVCDTYHKKREVTVIVLDGERLACCDDCKDGLILCDLCGEYTNSEKVSGDFTLCPSCYTAQEEEQVEKEELILKEE